MAVMVPRETLTEHRLDALEKKVDQGFAQIEERFKQVDQGFVDVKAEMREGFDRIEARSDERFKEADRRFDEVNARLGRLEDGFFALNRTLVGGAVVIAAALIGSSVL